MAAAFSSGIWNQLKSLTAGELCSALSRDGWAADTKGGSQHIYRKKFADGTVRRVSIHVHSHKTYGAAMLKGLLADIGWTDADLLRLKLKKFDRLAELPIID